MAGVGRMPVALMDEVRVVAMLDCLMAAALAMLVTVLAWMP